MSAITSWSVSFATSPVLSEVVSWDWAEDEFGGRTRYEYVVIPHEAVSGESRVITGKGAASLQRLLLAAARNEERAATTIVMLTISGEGSDFLAMGWTRIIDAIAEVLDYETPVTADQVPAEYRIAMSEEIGYTPAQALALSLAGHQTL